MKAIVTGAAGFAGSHAVEYLLKETDWELVCLDSYRHKGDHERLAWLQNNPRLHCLKADLSVPLLPRILRQFRGADYILNYASDSHVDRSILDPRSVWENNTNLILNVLEAARTCNRLAAFFQISTDEVYGPPLPGVLHPEWSPIIPSNVYSASKAAQEALCIAYWRTWDIPVVLTNSMNMIGERQDAEKFLPMVASLVMQGKDVPIHGSTAKVGSRYYTHAKNLASAIAFLARYRIPASFKNGDLMPDRWNIAGEKEVSNLDLALMVAEQLGKPLIYRFVEFSKARSGHDPRYALDGSKLLETGWRAPIQFEEAVQLAVRWCIANSDFTLAAIPIER